MQLLVTGGTGFVMSHVVRTWLERHSSASVVSVDIAPPDIHAERFFEPFRERLTIVTGDVRDPHLLDTIPGKGSTTHVVCGAAMTPSIGITEKSRAAMIAGVNVMGPVHCLEYARTLPRLDRMVHVSTGSVYGDDGPDDGGPLPEDGYVRPFPCTLYPITKLSGEMLAGRWREMFGLPLHVVRLASVYGPMDRPTPGRDFACAPHVMMHKALRGETWSVAGADGVGDFIHAADVAGAICDLLAAPALRHDVYNIASGEPTTLDKLARLVCSVVPGATWHEAAPGGPADVIGSSARKTGAWGAYDVTRILGDVQWRPRTLHQGLSDYAAWITENETDGPQSARDTPLDARTRLI